MIEPKLINGGLAVDDRGQLMFINEFDFSTANIKRFYVVSNHSKGFVRAWHGHKKEGKYVFVPKGSIILGMIPLLYEDTDVMKKHVLSEKKPQILYIPPGFYHGYMTLTDDTQVIFYSTATIEESKDDDYRLEANHWDIKTIEER
jgi:dTDP-4-dehydrorhamnose 3,5-epimerase